MDCDLFASEFQPLFQRWSQADIALGFVRVRSTTDTHRDFDQVTEALGARVYCVTPDLPSHGKSSGTSMTIPEGARALLAVHQLRNGGSSSNTPS
jgi:hypothetical protein